MTYWKKIPEFPMYEASTDGEIRSRYLYGGKKGRILKQVISGRYRKVTLHKEKKMYLRAVHRLVAMAFLPNPCKYAYVLHKDDNRENNTLINLKWGTHQHNMLDKIKNGNNRWRKISLRTINKIRTNSLLKTSYRKLSQIFGISQSTIRKIVLNLPPYDIIF